MIDEFDWLVGWFELLIMVDNGGACYLPNYVGLDRVDVLLSRTNTAEYLKTEEHAIITQGGNPTQPTKIQDKKWLEETDQQI